MVNCCCAKPVSVFEDIDDIGAPSRLSKWCGHLVSSVKKDPAISVLTHLFILSVSVSASVFASYLNYNPANHSFKDRNHLIPPALCIIGVCVIATTISECIRLKNLLKASRKLPSPCVVAAVTIAAAAIVAYWMREKASEEVDRYQMSHNLLYPARAYQMISSDPMPYWAYAAASSFVIAVVYHISLRGWMRCRRNNFETEPLIIN